MTASLAHPLAEALGNDQSGVGIRAASRSSLLQKDLLQLESTGEVLQQILFLLLSFLAFTQSWWWCNAACE